MSSVNEIGIRVSLVGGKAAAAEGVAVADSLKSIGTAATEAGAQATVASGGIDLLGASTRGLIADNAGASMSYTELIASTRAMSIDNTILIAKNDLLLTSIGGVGTASLASSAKTNIFTRSLERMGLSSTILMKDFATFGKYAGMAVVAAGAIVAYEGVKMAVSFSGATASLAASANISVVAANKIGNAFLSTAGKTEFSGQDMVTAYAQVAGQLSTLSGRALNTAQSLTFMSAAEKLTTASGGDLNSTTKALSSIMQVYHFNVNQASGASNILYNTSRLTANSLTSLETVSSRLHSRLGQMIPSLKDTGALLLDLAEHGAKGARGTMVVVGAMNTLLGHSKGVSAMLGTLGLSANVFVGPDGKFIGMSKAIGILQPKLAAMPQWLQLITEKTLFGAGASQLLGQMVLSGAGAYDTAKQKVTQYGVVNAAAAKQQESLHGQIKVITSAIHDYGVRIGEFLLPKLIKFGKWMVDHKPILIAFGIIIGTLIVGAIGTYIASIIIATSATAVFWAVATLGIAVAAVAIIAGIVWVATHWKRAWGDIKNFGIAVVEIIDNLLHNKFVLALLGPIGALIYLGEHWKAIWHGIQDVISTVWKFVKPIFDGIGKGLGLIGNVLGKVGGVIGSVGHFLGFAEGGVVPGPKGAPMMALVHGGEAIIPPQNVYSTSNISSTILGAAAGRISPTSTNGSVIPSQLISGQGGAGGTTVIQLVVDKKVLAETVYQQMQNDYARR